MHSTKGNFVLERPAMPCANFRLCAELLPTLKLLLLVCFGVLPANLLAAQNLLVERPEEVAESFFLPSTSLWIHTLPELGWTPGEGTLSALDNELAKQIHFYGYSPPVADQGGPDENVDIYLGPLGARLGFTKSENPLSNRTSAYIVVDPAAPNWLEVTAHEYHHVLQLASWAHAPRFLKEASAVLFEESVSMSAETFSELSEDYRACPGCSPFSDSETLDTEGRSLPLYEYGGATFFFFLNESYFQDDRDALRTWWATQWQTLGSLNIEEGAAPIEWFEPLAESLSVSPRTLLDAYMSWRLMSHYDSRLDASRPNQELDGILVTTPNINLDDVVESPSEGSEARLQRAFSRIPSRYLHEDSLAKGGCLLFDLRVSFDDQDSDGFSLSLLFENSGDENANSNIDDFKLRIHSRMDDAVIFNEASVQLDRDRAFIHLAIPDTSSALMVCTSMTESITPTHFRVSLDDTFPLELFNDPDDPHNEERENDDSDPQSQYELDPRDDDAGAPPPEGPSCQSSRGNTRSAQADKTLFETLGRVARPLMTLVFLFIAFARFRATRRRNKLFKSKPTNAHTRGNPVVTSSSENTNQNAAES